MLPDVTAVVTSALDKNVQQDRYLSSPRRQVVDTAPIGIWAKLTFYKNNHADIRHVFAYVAKKRTVMTDSSK